MCMDIKCGHMGMYSSHVVGRGTAALVTPRSEIYMDKMLDMSLGRGVGVAKDRLEVGAIRRHVVR